MRGGSGDHNWRLNLPGISATLKFGISAARETGKMIDPLNLLRMVGVKITPEQQAQLSAMFASLPAQVAAFQAGVPATINHFNARLDAIQAMQAEILRRLPPPQIPAQTPETL